MRPISLGVFSDPIMLNHVDIKKPQSRIEPGLIAPIPAKAPAFLRTHQMSPDLLLHPVFDISEAPTGVSDPKIIHPSSHDRIDQEYNPIYLLRVKWLKHLLEFS